MAERTSDVVTSPLSQQTGMSLALGQRSDRADVRASELEVRTETTALFAGTLQLYGNVRIPGASYYQVLRSVDFGAGFVPFTGLTWPVYRVVGNHLEVHWTVPDAGGWYPILPESEHWFPDTLLLEWPPDGQGRYLLRVQCADDARNPIGEVSTRVVHVDNTTASVTYQQLAWKFTTEPDASFDDPGHDLLVSCPTIHRGTSAESIQVMFRVRVSPAHFRYASLGISGCGTADFTLAADPANHTSHWYTTSDDATDALQGRFELASGAPEGAYSFNVYASSRAIGPSSEGAVRADEATSDRVPLHVSPTVPVAIMD